LFRIFDEQHSIYYHIQTHTSDHHWYANSQLSVVLHMYDVIIQSTCIYADIVTY